MHSEGASRLTLNESHFNYMRAFFSPHLRHILTIVQLRRKSLFNSVNLFQNNSPTTILYAPVAFHRRSDVVMIIISALTVPPHYFCHTSCQKI